MATVTVHVRLFASYAEQLGTESIEMTVPAPAHVGTVVDRLRTLPGGTRLPSRPLCALNLAHVDLDAALQSGDEIAILPPLAGG